MLQTKKEKKTQDVCEICEFNLRTAETYKKATDKGQYYIKAQC